MFEAGYKGVLGDRLLLAADAWYSQRKNLVTPLLVQTPLILIDGPSTGAYLVPRLTQFFQAPASHPRRRRRRPRP